MTIIYSLDNKDSKLLQCCPRGKKGIHSKTDVFNEYLRHLTTKAAFLRVEHAAIIKVHQPCRVYGNSCWQDLWIHRIWEQPQSAQCGMVSLLLRALSPWTRSLGLNLKHPWTPNKYPYRQQRYFPPEVSWPEGSPGKAKTSYQLWKLNNFSKRQRRMKEHIMKCNDFCRLESKV